MIVLAIGLLDVLGAVVGVMLCLTGLAVAFMGFCALIEGTRARGAGGIIAGLGMLAGGLALSGFIG